MKIRYTKHKLHCEIAVPKLLDYLTGTYIRCRLVIPKRIGLAVELRSKILLVTLRELSLKNKPITRICVKVLVKKNPCRPTHNSNNVLGFQKKLGLKF